MLTDLAVTPISETLRKLSVERRSGDLQVQSGRVVKTVFFDHGRIVFAASNLKKDRLGEALVALGRITDEQFTRLLPLVKDRAPGLPAEGESHCGDARGDVHRTSGRTQSKIEPGSGFRQKAANISGGLPTAATSRRARFRFPMCAKKGVEAFHEPERRTPIRRDPIRPTRRIGVRRSA